VRAMWVDWLSHWILLLTGGVCGVVWGWWGLLGAIIGWSMVNLVYRMGASNTDTKPHDLPSS
jgi:hypothetical protein